MEDQRRQNQTKELIIINGKVLPLSKNERKHKKRKGNKAKIDTGKSYDTFDEYNSNQMKLFDIKLFNQYLLSCKKI